MFTTASTLRSEKGYYSFVTLVFESSVSNMYSVIP